MITWEDLNFTLSCIVISFAAQLYILLLTQCPYWTVHNFMGIYLPLVFSSVLRAWRQPFSVGSNCLLVWGGIISQISTFKSAVVSPICSSHSSEPLPKDLQDFTTISGELRGIEMWDFRCWRGLLVQPIVSTRCLPYPTPLGQELLLCSVLQSRAQPSFRIYAYSQPGFPLNMLSWSAAHISPFPPHLCYISQVILQLSQILLLPSDILGPELGKKRFSIPFLILKEVTGVLALNMCSSLDRSSPPVCIK